MSKTKTTKTRNYRHGTWQYWIRLSFILIAGVGCLLVAFVILDQILLYESIRDRITRIEQVAEFNGWTEKRIEAVHQLTEERETLAEKMLYFRYLYKASKTYRGPLMRVGLLLTMIVGFAVGCFGILAFFKVIYRDYLKHTKGYLKKLKRYYLLKITRGTNLKA